MKSINFLNLSNIKQTDGKISSKAASVASYIFFISILAVLVSTIGYQPLFCLYTKIKSIITIFIILITIGHAYSLIHSEKQFKIFINTKKIFIFFLMSILVIFLGFISSFLIINYKTEYDVNSVEINYVASFFLLSIILIPYISIMYFEIVLPLLIASDEFTKDYHKEKNSYEK